MVEIDDPVSGMGELQAVAGLDVLAVRQPDLTAQQCKGVIEDAVYVFWPGLPPLKEVGRVHDDAQPR